MFNKQKQQGAALVTGLIFMVVLTLLVVAGMRTTILEEKMAGNARDVDLAFQSAEAALRAGEDVLNGAALPAFAGTGAYLTQGNRSTKDWLTVYNWSTAAAYPSTLAGTYAAPQYVIEQTPAVPASGGSLKAGVFLESGIFKVTARGTGGNPNTQVFLQSAYRR